MGFLSWLFGKENDPPEPLVLGAKLRCPYGDQDSYLMVFSDDIDINNLPKATVDDCRPIINILPFGNCYAEGICESEMSFTDQWINPEPQSEKVNGKEVITTKSILVCSKSGMNLKIINSGQDGIVAGQIKFILDMDKKYKGLREILDDPYGSLYLNEGKYRQAIRFLEELVKKNGGEIPLSIMYDKDNIEGSYIKSTLSHLLPSCNLQDFAQYISGMETIAVKNSVDSETLDVRILNAELIELIKTDCQDTDDKIKNGGFYRWNEEHKLFLSVLADGAMNLAYVALLYSSMINSKATSFDKEPDIEQKVEWSESKEKELTPQKINYDSKQIGKKWGKHKWDYPEMSSYNDYINHIENIFQHPERVIHDIGNKEFLYIKGEDLLRIGENGDFVSVYPGIESAKVIKAIDNGGLIWPKY